MLRSGLMIFFNFPVNFGTPCCVTFNNMIDRIMCIWDDFINNIYFTGQVTFRQEVKKAIMNVIHTMVGASVEVVGGVIPATSIMVGKITITNVGIRGAIASKNRDMVNSYFHYFWLIFGHFWRFLAI